MKSFGQWSLLLLVLSICGCGGEMQDDELTTQGANDVVAATAGGAASSVATTGVVGVTMSGSAGVTTAPASVCGARRTTEVKLAGNLDSKAVTPLGAWNLKDAVNTGNFSDTITLYDDAETSLTCDVYFRKEAENVWSYHVLFNSDTAPVECGTGELQYDVTGALLRRIEFSPMHFPETSKSRGIPIAIVMGSSRVAGYGGLDGMIQQSGPSNMFWHWQDGQLQITGNSCRDTEPQATGG